jgi:hypothetical protein
MLGAPDPVDSARLGKRNSWAPNGLLYIPFLPILPPLPRFPLCAAGMEIWWPVLCRGGCASLDARARRPTLTTQPGGFRRTLEGGWKPHEPPFVCSWIRGKKLGRRRKLAVRFWNVYGIDLSIALIFGPASSVLWRVCTAVMALEADRERNVPTRENLEQRLARKPTFHLFSVIIWSPRSGLPLSLEGHQMSRLRCGRGSSVTCRSKSADCLQLYCRAVWERVVRVERMPCANCF